MSRQVVNNFNKRGNVFSLVLNDSGADVFHDSRHIFMELNTDLSDHEFIAVIKHENDFDNELKRYKTPHYHVVIKFGGAYRVATIINKFVDIFHCNANQVSCEKCNAMDMQVRYLIHLDDMDKYRYDISDIVTNRHDLVNKYMKEIHKIVDIDDLLSIMDMHKNLRDLISCIGLDNYRKYRCVIQDIYRERGIY